MKKVLLIALIAVFLAGCAYQRQYISPTEGPTAKLMIPSPSKKWTFFGGFSSAGVNLAPKNEKGCGRIYRVLVDNPGEKYSTVVIPGDKDMFFTAGAMHGNAYCNVDGLFHSEKDGTYRLDFQELGDRCMVTIKSIDAKGNEENVRLTPAYRDGVTACESKDKK